MLLYIPSQLQAPETMQNKSVVLDYVRGTLQSCLIVSGILSDVLVMSSNIHMMFFCLVVVLSWMSQIVFLIRY